MKRFMKILGITGIVFCLCGVGMTGIGYAFGGGDYIRTENLTDIKNVFFWNTGHDLESVSGDVSNKKADTGNITAGNIEKDNVDNTWEEKKGNVSGDLGNVKTWKSDDIRLRSVNSIKAELDFIDLNIKVSEDNDFHLSYELHCVNRENPFSYRLKNGVLTLTEQGFKPPSLKEWIWNTGSVTDQYYNFITLYVPSDTILKSCIFDVVDCDLTIEGFHCNTMEIKTADGDISIKEGIFSKAMVKTEDGDIAFSNIVMSEDLQIDTADGDILLSDLKVKGVARFNAEDGDVSLAGLKVSRDMKINVADGDIGISSVDVLGATEMITCDGDISISGVKESGGISIQTDCGDISASALRITGAMRINTEDGDVLLSSLGVSGRVTIDSECGDISVQIQKKSLPKLKITMDTEEGNLSASRSLGGKRSGGHYEKSGSGSAYLKGYTEEGDISIQ